MGAKVKDYLKLLTQDNEWGLEFVEEAIDDLEEYARSGLIKIILAAIIEGHKNPLPKEKGGKGNILGYNHDAGDGRPALYWKLKSIGVRIIYGLEPPVVQEGNIIKKKNVLILVIGPRRDKEVYHTAVKRLVRYKEKIVDYRDITVHEHRK